MGRAGWSWRDRLVASDPGLNRFRMAAGGVLCMGTVLGVEYLYAGQTGASSKGALIAMLLGAVVAMMGSMGLSGTARNKGVTAIFFPVAMGVGMVVGAAVAKHRDLLLGVFVLVMFAAVYVRRFGPRFFIYGFMGWIGYFFASFLGASFATLPTLIGDVVIASAWVLVVSLTVLRTRSDHVLHRTLEAFGARARAVAGASAEMLGGSDLVRWRRRLHSRQVRLNETALMIDGQLGDASALPGEWSAATLRRYLLDAQLSVDGLATAALELSVEADAGVLTARAGQVARALGAGDRPGAEEAATALLDAAIHQPGPGAGARHQARHLAIAALDYTKSVRHWSSPAAPDPAVTDPAAPDPAVTEEQVDFEPAVTLMMGNLPGSAAVAKDVAPRGGWNPLSRLDLTTRQAIQVGLAGGLAILAGRQLSSARYYWAVIGAFVVFSGTATRSETLIKGANRVVGTLTGLGLAIVLAHLTAGNTAAVLAVILASVFCGFYLLRVSYACMIFFITIMVAQLYSVLHEFTNQLLVLRLEETAIGAAIGITVALVFLPVSTRDTVRIARAGFYVALHDLIVGVADRLAQSDEAVDLDALSRSLDNRLQQLNLVMRPLTRPLLFGAEPAEVRHRLTLYTACSTYARGLTAALRRSQPTARSAHLSGATHLAEACRSLGAAATALAQGDRAGRVAAEAVERLDDAASILARRSGPDDSRVDPVEHALSRLHQALHQLAGSPTTSTRGSPTHPPGPPVPVTQPARATGVAGRRT